MNRSVEKRNTTANATASGDPIVDPIHQYRSNDRYVRKFLRPVAKSVYQDSSVRRVNGSLNSTVASPGFISNEMTNKRMHSGNVQVQMTQTFNLGILNNTFQVGGPQSTKNKSVTSPYDDSFATGGMGPRAIRTFQAESSTPFTVLTNVKIPDMTEQRKEEREERQQNLQKRPKHKEAAATQQDKLMSAPLTM